MESTEAELKTTTTDLDNAQRDLAQQKTTTEQQATTLQVITLVTLILASEKFHTFEFVRYIS